MRHDPLRVRLLQNAKTIACLAALAGAAKAQEPPAPVYAPCSLDSGPVDWSPAAAFVHVGDVAHANAGALQLHFAPSALPMGTRLRLVAAHDGAVQWFDGRSLADYSHVSAWFNGDRVRVELWPGPGTTNNRVRVTKLRLGDVVAPTEGLCQASDLRTPSADPRVGRIDGCCTAFLCDERTLVTAGHCIGAIGGQMVHFNVPLSDQGGNAQYPPPQDQYALRQGSLTSVNGGVGNDYAVMAAVRNSNTGFYPGQMQSWFEAALPPVGSGPQTWTVTGYGTTGANPTWSLAQKSASGPRATTNTATLQFRISVSGCNSGSPVIAQDGIGAHGVVTHAGCTATGGSNYGTGFGHAAFAQALAYTQQNFVAGTFALFGQGCPGAVGVPVLHCTGTPDLGGHIQVVVTSTDPANDAPGFLLVGVSNTNWNGAPLPIDLLTLGLAGCSLRVSPDLALPLSTGFGQAQQGFTVPNQPEFLGQSLYFQHFAHDASATASAQTVTGNCARARLGN
jgi:V8-like Glu-specific endopeptidase